MDVPEFRSQIKPRVKLSIENLVLTVKEVIKFRLDDGTFYVKCFLSEDFVLADDLNENIFILVKRLKTEFKPPFPKEVNYQDKNFQFIYTAHALAESIQGEEIFKQGESERFWDYKAEDDSYLSLGIIDKTGERMDLSGKIVPNKDINFIV